MNISTEYHEDKKKITVTVFQDRKPIVKTYTDKATGITLTDVYKEGSENPIETYVFSRDTDF